jgi:hypothetical protein
MAVIRGCGTRVAGGIYLVCSLSPNGTPLADFIVDPPIPLDAQERADLGVKPIGMTYVEPVYEIRETTDPTACRMAPGVSKSGRRCSWTG